MSRDEIKQIEKANASFFIFEKKLFYLSGYILLNFSDKQLNRKMIHIGKEKLTNESKRANDGRTKDPIVLP